MYHGVFSTAYHIEEWDEIIVLFTNILVSSCIKKSLQNTVVQILNHRYTDRLRGILVS